MEWFNRVIMGAIRGLMASARSDYGVDPVVFIVIYLASGPFFYYSIFRMVRALARRLRNEITVWSMVFLAATAAPFLYVLFFGHNLPWWVYVVIGLLIGQGVYSLVRRLTKKQPAAPSDPSAGKKQPAAQLDPSAGKKQPAAPSDPSAEKKRPATPGGRPSG
jgi:hypothetical protein